MAATDVSAPGTSTATASARARLDRAFAALRRQGIAALPGFGWEPALARQEVVEELTHRRPHGPGWYALWTEKDNRACLDQHGALIAPLPVLHHPAAGAAVAAALSHAGLTVIARGSDRLTVGC